ncbi:SAM and SH3 domain-containing protein 3-like, partial [Contarinia nasturtii]|uniref:SAM and SH3 domain-containing protein 3-like n=1 Tax=Contarinia nasturtii TaxID=265458 RepID=UPI0012D3FFDA
LTLTDARTQKNVQIGTNNCTARYRTLSGGIGESPSLSPSPSSDYDDDETITKQHLPNLNKNKRNGTHKGAIISQKVTVHHPNDLRNSPKELKKFNETNRKFNGTKDVSRDFSNSQDNTDRGSISDQAFACSASSVESLPSASGSSTQALVRPGSPNSSISEDRINLKQPICLAKALVDCLPSSYDKEALRFMKGDLIEVISMNASGIWRGRCHGRLGHFKFINVEVLPDQRCANNVNTISRGGNNGIPTSVEDLLVRIGLKEYTSVFVLNGYEDLELFKELEPADLDYLGIINNDHRAKLLTAVQLLHDIDVISDGDVAGSSSENDETRFNQMNNKKHGSSPFGRRHFPRDSGCYEGSPVPNVNQSHQTTVIDESAHTLDDVVAQCSNEILKRVESARRMKDEKTSAAPMKGVQRMAKKGLLGGGTVLGSNADDTLSRGGALSEKSSDSGVSSSSLSSGPLKNNS